MGNHRRRLSLVTNAVALSVELVVLGLAQDGGHPQAGCVRSCCAAAFAERGGGHHISCLGLRDGDDAWLLDATPDLGRQAWAVGGVVRGVWLTHAHVGHYAGVLQLGKEAWAAQRMPLFAMAGMVQFLLANQPFASVLSDGHALVVPLRADEPVVLSPRLRVTPWLVPHRGPWSETVGLLIEGPHARALYLPDIDAWEPWERDLAQVAAQVDALFIDGTFYDAAELPGRDLRTIPHPTVCATMDRLQSLPDEVRARVYFIHLNHTNPLLDPDSAASHEVERRGFRVAREGQRLRL
jgi:pyrroloquinoline quinone biosynthesis protein B